MPAWLHRTNKTVLRSIASADLPEAIANYIEEPDLSAVVGQPARYWIVAGDTVSLADQATRDAIDTAALSAVRDVLADEIDTVETFSRAFALVVLDEFNARTSKINSILAAIAGANNLNSLKSAAALITDLPIYSPAQLKAVVRLKADS
ncbi:hypothetical protein LCGC14_1607060 [marine sediment metagenome]|uniref:Uncharacterized protein n=1 Tax=marine sediment metagenome TaxID=412755 RepID=A0A0F9L9G0_9ZZZZ